MTLHQRFGSSDSAKASTVGQVVAFQARLNSARIALIEGSRSWTYAELEETIQRTAQWLRESNVRPGDRLMLVCENSCSAVAIYLACTVIGAWPVIVNARLSAREIDDIAAHCDARCIIFTSGASLRAKAHGERYGAAISDPANFGAVALGPLNETARPEPMEDDPAQNVAALIYTTGTTGRPKGVMLSHRNLLFVAHATAKARGLSAEDKVAAILPISHILGLSGVLLGSLVSGAQLRLYARFDPAMMFSDLDQGQIGVMIGTPSMYALLTEYARRNARASVSPPRLRLISSAGAPLDIATKSETETVFNQVLHNGYGITECSPTITLTALDAPRNDCSVGRLLSGVELKLAGAAQGAANVGELWVRSPGVMKGYYKSPDETAEAIDAEGWFRTGDLARVEDGNLFIVGRAKEMIIRFGYNVYPAEIEGVLNAHPDVFRSAVIGRKREDSEEIEAFVQLAPGASIAAVELRDYLAAELAPYKQPSKLSFIPVMPMSAGGKILKSALAAKP